ncbi:MAG: hypothetical protein ACQZ3N_09060 [cyanobacterium endosymbiont of Rhopalodia yunnanensis]
MLQLITQQLKKLAEVLLDFTNL